MTYLVDQVLPSSDGSFYRVQGKIRRLLLPGETAAAAKGSSRRASTSTKATKTPATAADLPTCTEIGTGAFDGKPVGMVKGVLVGETAPKVLFPGEVPPAPPPPELWAAQHPDFPVFRPPRIDPEGTGGVPQIGLDEALDILIGDKFS